MKNKNPLYVVKGKDVQEVNSLFDMMVKKFNLEPVINVLKSVLSFLLDQVENYALFVAVKSFLDEMIEKLGLMFRKWGILPG